MEDIKIDLMHHKVPQSERLEKVVADLEEVDLSKATLVPQTYAVTGMTCSACVNSVERSLNSIPGVSASVNFASETVHILAPAEVKAEVIIRAVKAAGYSASLLEDRQDPALHRKGAARAPARSAPPRPPGSMWCPFPPIWPPTLNTVRWPPASFP